MDDKLEVLSFRYIVIIDFQIFAWIPIGSKWLP